MSQLSETLLKTYPIDHFIGSSWSKFHGITTKKTSDYAGYLFVSGKATSDDLKAALDWIQLYGYYPSYYSENLTTTLPYDEAEVASLIHNVDGFFVGFGAKHTKVLDPDAINSDVIYHITYAVYAEKILDVGLVPKASRKRENHPSRVYLCFAEEGIPMLVSAFKRHNPSRGIICISLKKSGLPELYLDPNFKYGCFTVKNVDKRFILDIINK